MREFTKSMVSFSWSLSLLALRELGDLITRPDPNRPRHPATERLDAVTQATEEQLGDLLGETFRAGDRFQRGMVDMMSSLFGLGPRGAGGMGDDRWWPGCGPCRRQRDARADWRDAGRPEGSTGWGPMPDDCARRPVAGGDRA
jgi:hypothetical protein